MIIDHKKLSDLIRSKKKQMLANPEVVKSAPTELNANDVMQLQTDARIQETIKSPEKINADDSMMAMSADEANNIGLSAEEKSRMARLSAYLDKLDM